MVDIPFVPGLALSRRFYEEGVAPLLARHFPGVDHAAGRLDGGSDVLGFDTPQSRDHDWGPRLQLFLAPADLARHGEAIDGTMQRHLPREIAGYSTHFSAFEDGALGMAPAGEGLLRHNVQVTSPETFLAAYLVYDPSSAPTTAEWLSFPQQRLRTIGDGLIFHDDDGRLTAVRDRLHYYPDAIWRYMMAVQWRRLSQEEALVGRTHQVGDLRGGRLIASRMTQEAMRLAFLQVRRYWPYAKWFGSAFSQLEAARWLGPLLDVTVATDDPATRERSLNRALSGLAEAHNGLNVTAPLTTDVSPYFTRPFDVLHCDRFADALWETIDDADVRALPRHLGGIDQFVDSTDVLSYPDQFARLRDMYLR